MLYNISDYYSFVVISIQQMSNNDKIPSNFPRLYAGQLSSVYNYADFQQTTATVGDLSNYANLYDANSFVNTNTFQAIEVASLNNIPDTTIAYMANVTSDIQQQFNTLSNKLNSDEIKIDNNTTNISLNTLNLQALKNTVTNDETLIATNTSEINSVLSTLTNVSYDAQNNVTNINDNVSTNEISVKNNVSIAGNTNISNTLNVNYINNETMLNNTINTCNLNAKSINLNSCPITDIGIYLYCTVVILSYGAYTSTILSFPLFGSTLISNLSIQPLSTFSANIVIKPGYRIDILNQSNNVLFSYENTTTSVIYFHPVTCNDVVYKINVFYRGILI